MAMNPRRLVSETDLGAFDASGELSRPGCWEDVLAALELGSREVIQRRVGDLTRAALEASGRGLDLTGIDLTGRDLSGLDLRHAVLNRAVLYGATLCDADLTGASLVCAGLERTDFRGASLVGAYVHSMAAQASNFSGADLKNLVDATGALFHGCQMREVSLEGAELAGTTFYQCDLARGRLASADLRGAVFNECRLDHGDLTGASLGDAQFLRCGMRASTLHGAQGKDVGIHHPTCADNLHLEEAHLPGMRLVGVRARDLHAEKLRAPSADVSSSHLGGSFASADLTGSRWRESAIDECVFGDAALADSTWRSVSARKVDFQGCRGEGMQVSDSSFVEARFQGFAGRYCEFRNSDLRSCDFSRAYLYRATIIGDPPTSASAVDSDFDGSNLTQAYLAADFTGARIRNAWATYARINQCTFADADLSGTPLFRSSAVKVDFTGAKLPGQRGLFFADRCTGLSEAMRDTHEEDCSPLTELIADLGTLLARDTGKST